ncbi:GPI anchored endo-1,3(4)-beta-glucanase [Beauveria brongniartii RCEF 3172]|uniref:GPI anchored endo-1,3(4)-beta-glucanase n=1 Tax=Beauveria brongniartii RCEF 3172 TaxID=1081107 RepID=A0A167B936_9HYPO|nr:GPI anchored endo-1,3(4)-beta-glucanase [Beauveria brongniartii RCEF 3172]
MAYSLATSYAGDALINGFNWIDTRDPSNGYVRYQSQANAASQGLFAVDQDTGVVRIGVDHTNTLDVSGGRPSIRLESKEAYNQGLFVADFLHMPPSQCGVWPAFWAYGPNWPNNGEIDIIEGANTAHRNIISAHTNADCSLGDDVLRMASGAAQNKDCNVVGADNVGCGYVTPASDTSSYGDTFNAVGGGIYAMLWDDDFIKVWHFDRDAAPADIAAKKPSPAGWGKPAAVYGGKSCDVESHFRDMSIVLNINFCGDYGNAVWKSDGCSALAPTCAEWVAKNPAAFANAYWDVNYIDAYVQSASNTSTMSSVSSGNLTSSTVPSQSQPSNIPITSLSSTLSESNNNGTLTRFPAANSSSTSSLPTANNNSSAPTSLVLSSLAVPSFSGPSNSSSSSASTALVITNIPTRFSSSSTVVVSQGGPIPTASLPSPSGPLRANPANLNDFSYLGCFGSSSDFKSFAKVGDSPDMNLNKCTELCRGKKYAGVFETACYCASELDADTRVSADACDEPCPGDSTQLCGGRAKPRGNWNDGSIGATANVTLPQTTTFISGVAMPISTGGGGLPGSSSSSSSGAYASGSYSNSTGPETPNTFSSSAWNIVTDPKTAASGSYGSSFPTSVIGAATTRNRTTLQTLPTGSGSSAFNPSVVPSSVRFTPSGSPSTNSHGAWFNSTSPETPTPASISSQTGTAPVIRTSSRFGTAPVVSISSRSSAAPPVIGTAPIVSISSRSSAAPPVIGTAPPVSVVTIPVYPQPKVTKSTVSSGSSSRPPSSAAVSGSAPAPFGNSTLAGRRRYSPVRLSMPKHARRAHVDRREASDMLLTVYAAIAKEEPPKQPPGMGGATSGLSTQPSSSTDTPTAAQQSTSMDIPAQQSFGASIPAQQSSGAGIPAQQSSGGSSPGQQAPGTGFTNIPNFPAQQSAGNAAAMQTPSTVTSTTTTVVTTVTYQTVYPSNPSKVVNKVFVTTIIKAHCGCTETPLPTMTVSMTTTVLSCAACGPRGQNYVTVTVPCDESEATPTAVANLPPAPNSNGKVPGTANKNLIPSNGDSVPPTSGGNKPPASNDSVPPGSNGSVPPGTNGSVPPGTNGSVPPGTNGSVPPGTNGSVPPGTNGSVPPGTNGSVPPGTNGSVPPGTNGSVPPGTNGSVPPGTNGSVPPGTNGSVPPGSNSIVPPASGGNVPTPANNDKPPASNGNAPSSANNDKTPVSNGNVPSAPNSNAPPAPNSNKPPAANSNKTPSSSSGVPPAVSGNKPAAPSSTVPTVAGASGFKATWILFTTMLAMVVLL